jgi:hypothetical protein
LRAENQRLREAGRGRSSHAVWPVVLALGVGAADAWGFVTVVGWVNAPSDGHFVGALALVGGMVAAHVVLGWYTFGRGG